MVNSCAFSFWTTIRFVLRGPRLVKSLIKSAMMATAPIAIAIHRAICEKLPPFDVLFVDWEEAVCCGGISLSRRLKPSLERAA